MGWEEKGEGDWRGAWSTTPFLGICMSQEFPLSMINHRIVKGLASPVSLSPRHPELGAKAPDPKAVEGALRLTNGLGKKVSLGLENVSLAPPSSLSRAHAPAALFQVGLTSPRLVKSQVRSPAWLRENRALREPWRPLGRAVPATVP